MDTPPRIRRYEALDGLRGIAALAVMVYHLTQNSGLHYLRNAWIAVDMFFVLSGFVIMHSCGHKILSGMSFKSFMVWRLIRLAPLHAAGVLIGSVAAGVVIFSPAAGGTGLDGFALLKISLLGLFSIPYFGDVAWPMSGGLHAGPLFPLNPPTWSLFFEWVVNIGFFFYIIRARRIGTLFVLFWMGVLTVSNLYVHTVNPGWSAEDFVWGFPRVIAEFSLGSLLYQYHQRIPSRLALPILINVAAFCIFFTVDNILANVGLLLLQPAAVLASATMSARNESVSKACTLLGELSYPIYITHLPVANLAENLFHTSALEPHVQLLVLCAAVIFCASLLVPIDKRVRSALTTWWR